MFGNGVTTYIMLFTTSGLPSCPCSTPVENVLAALSCATLAAVICASEEKRDMARSPLGVVHSLPAGAAMARAAVAAAGAALFTAQRHQAVRLVSWYWHFVDVIWIGIFAMLYIR